MNMKCFNDNVIAQFNRSGCQYPQRKMEYANIELIKCLLSSVRNPTKDKAVFLQDSILKEMIVKEDEHPKPVICFIGTHADRLEKEYDNVVNHIDM